MKSRATRADDVCEIVVAHVDRSLDKALLALQKAQSDYNAVAWRPDVGMTTQAQTLQTATIDYQTALANYQINVSNINDIALKQAQTSLESSQVSVDQAKRNIEKAKLYAPFDGAVSAVNASVGDICQRRRRHHRRYGEFASALACGCDRRWVNCNGYCN